MNSKHTTTIAGGLLLLFGGAAMAQTPIKVINPGFTDGATRVATGWTLVNGSGTNAAPSNYAETVPDIGNRTMQLKSDGGNYIQQALTATAAEVAVDASSFGTWSISFLKGYRRDAVRNGNHVLRVSLWNTTSDSELAGYDLTIVDPGSTGTNSLSPSTIVLTYDQSAPALVGAGIALRVRSTSSDLGSSASQRTAILDDVSIVAGGIDPILEVATVPPFASDGAPATYTVNFTNQGATQNLTVTGVTIAGPGASSFTVSDFTASTAPGATGQIRVGFTPAGAGTYTADLVIASNASGNPSVTVPISVNVVDPVVALAVEKVDFGTLASNPGTQTINLVVSNEGGGTDLAIYNAQLTGFGANGFAVESVPEPIAPGASGIIVISFNPGAAGGDFGDILRIETNSAVSPTINLPVKAKVGFTAATKPLYIVNGSFDANTWNSSTGAAPAGWTSSLAASNQGGNYGQGGGTAANLTPNLTSIAAHMQAVGGYYEQHLTANNGGLNAASTGTATITLDYGYRNDSSTAGPILLRVELRDSINDVEVAGREIVIENPGVLAGAAANQLTPASLHLTYPATGTESLALRITQLAPRLSVNPWQATSIFDNVAVAVNGSWVAPANPYAGWALQSGLDGSPGKEDAAGADPDGDGVPNIEEFAFGGDPLSANSRPLVAGIAVDTATDALKEMLITLAVRSGAVFTGSTATIDGVSYGVQGSLDLQAFETAVEGPLARPRIPELLPAVAPAGYRYVSFRLAGSNGLPGKGFLKATAEGQ